jgi:asparagine synthase (glutamine-hydrolysing)
MGPEWLAYRLSYATRIRTGALRRKMPATAWNDQPLKQFLKDQSLAEPQSYLEYRRTQAPGFFFSPDRRAEYQPCFERWDDGSDTPVKLCEELEQGRLRYFEHNSVQAGFPPAWHANPFAGEQAPADHHWSEIGDFDNGDIKIIWEPSRFGFTYALVRAYWRTGDQRYGEMFWRLVGDWREHNVPQLGVNWKCGQEISFRVMAWCFGLYGFLDAEATSPERVAHLAQMIAVSGARVEANLDFALSQHNNHGISEGLGLWTVGALFPEFRLADQWKKIGRQVLETQGRELIYDDGAFAQHSANYHRLMLHDYLWTLQLGEVLNQPFTRELKERVSRAGQFLYQIQDEASGRVPYYGHNDGALILPLSNCDYQDFRPVVQATQYFGTRTRCYSPGPWDEDLLWLFGPNALAASVAGEERTDFEAKQGGCYTLRAENGFVFTRCAAFRHRPAQADLLHVDLWWRGQNIALDAGTYSYNAPPPWDDPLSNTAHHNTVTVDGRDQMDRVGRFLWLPWVTGRVRSRARSAAGHLAYWEGEHDGFTRLNVPALHRRAIVRFGEYWLVLDRVTSSADHNYRMQWLLLDAPWDFDESKNRLTLNTRAGSYFVQVASSANDSACSTVRADESSPRGWRAPYYNCREPAVSLALTARGSSLCFWTAFGPEPCRVTSSDDALEVQADRWLAKIDLRMENNRESLVASISLTGAVQDQLEIG